MQSILKLVSPEEVNPNRSFKIKIHISIFMIFLTLSVCSLSYAETRQESVSEKETCDDRTEFIPCDQPPTCAELCAIDRHQSRERCEVYYDVGTCFGLLSCVEDMETGLVQCENRADTIFSMCASRCYRPLLPEYTLAQSSPRHGEIPRRMIESSSECT